MLKERSHGYKANYSSVIQLSDFVKLIIAGGGLPLWPQWPCTFS